MFFSTAKSSFSSDAIVSSCFSALLSISSSMGKSSLIGEVSSIASKREPDVGSSSSRLSMRDGSSTVSVITSISGSGVFGVLFSLKSSSLSSTFMSDSSSLPSRVLSRCKESFSGSKIKKSLGADSGERSVMGISLGTSDSCGAINFFK